MKPKILKLLQEKYDRTSQGIYVVGIANELDLPIDELKIFLNELHKEKKNSRKTGNKRKNNLFKKVNLKNGKNISVNSDNNRIGNYVQT